MFKHKFGPTRIRPVTSPTSSKSLKSSYKCVHSISSTDNVSPATPESKKPKYVSSNIATDTHNVVSPDQNRLHIFQELIYAPVCKMELLREISWNGVPNKLRSIVWALLLNYLPSDSSRREQTRITKMKEYEIHTSRYTSSRLKSTSPHDVSLVHQIKVDLPRTTTDLPFVQHPRINLMLTRVLLLWAVRHPAAGYVQGMNDLAIPLLIAILTPKVSQSEPSDFTMDGLEEEEFMQIESDLYYLFEKFLDPLECFYINNQNGFNNMVLLFDMVLAKCNETSALHDHFTSIGVHSNLFAFRWMSCLLFRELPHSLVLRMIDTYLADGNFVHFHIFVCVAILRHFVSDLIDMDFASTLMFLQDLKQQTKTWPTRLLEDIFSFAFVLQSQYGDAVQQRKASLSV
ncbi:hypothetical protein P9112_011263 [Eukaryota sp. TZLM1-RC]